MTQFRSNRRQRSHGVSKVAVVVGLLLVASVVLSLAFVFVGGPSMPAVNIPSPNAVDTLAEASSKMTGYLELLEGDKQIEELDETPVRQFLVDNAEPLELYHVGAEQGCAVVVDYEKGLQAVFEDDTIVNFRTALYLPRAAARLAQLEGRSNDAAEIYAKMFILTSQLGSHGALVHAQMGFAFERLALTQLKELADALDPETRETVVQLLESAERIPRDWDAMLDRERVLLNNEHGAIQMAYMRFMTRNMQNDSLKVSQDTDAEILALLSETLEKLRP